MHRFTIIATNGRKKHPQGQKLLVMGRTIDFPSRRDAPRCRRRQILRAERLCPQPQRWKACFLLLSLVSRRLAYYDGLPYPWGKE